MAFRFPWSGRKSLPGNKAMESPGERSATSSGKLAKRTGEAVSSARSDRCVPASGTDRHVQVPADHSAPLVGRNSSTAVSPGRAHEAHGNTTGPHGKLHLSQGNCKPLGSATMCHDNTTLPHHENVDNVSHGSASDYKKNKCCENSTSANFGSENVSHGRQVDLKSENKSAGGIHVQSYGNVSPDSHGGPHVCRENRSSVSYGNAPFSCGSTHKLGVIHIPHGDTNTCHGGDDPSPAQIFPLPEVQEDSSPDASNIDSRESSLASSTSDVGSLSSESGHSQQDVARSKFKGAPLTINSDGNLGMPFSSHPDLPSVQITQENGQDLLNPEQEVSVSEQPRSHPCSPRRIRRQSFLSMVGFEYLIVANPPERSKDDSSVGSKNGQLSRTGSLTVLRRSTGPNSRKTSVSSPTSSVVSADSDSYASVNLGTEKLPPIDTPEASHVCSIRLRHLLRRIHRDDIPKEDLVRNLEYAASVLETVYIDETRHSQNASNVDSAYAEANSDSSPLQSAEHSPSRHYNNAGSRDRKRTHVSKRRLCDEDDELSEVEPDAVPSEVRDWLALTFTRSMSNIKRRGEEKPRFRSVAHAIRAGIMVDRIYRRMSSSVGLHVPPNVLLLLKNLDDWSFNVFSVSDAGDGHAIKFVGYELLQKYDLITKFKINTTTLDSFLMHLEQGYSKYQNPYHNLLHGADVAQTVHCVLTQSKMGQWLTDLEVFATLIAALIHDFEHTGTTNNFHIMTGSELALLYNDKAVLENHHISSCFKMFKEDEYNILSNLSREEYREFRSLVIDMVLATDMSYHFQQIKNMKNLLSMPENIDKSKALSLVVHCADISHPAKDLSLHINWTERLLEEFFRQGDREQAQGLPFSPLCDRKNTLVAESQIGFIEFIVDPSFTVMGDMLEKIMAPLHQQQQQQQSPRKKDSSISEEVFDSQEKGTSTPSSLNSRPPTPHTPTSPAKRYTLKRPWGEHLSANKLYWKERAAKDAQERALQQGHQEQLASTAEQSDSGVESPNPAKEEAKGDNSEKDSVDADKTVDNEKQNSEPKDSECSTTTTSNSNPVDIKPLVKGISRQTSTTGLLDKVMYPSPGVSRQTSTTGLFDKLKTKSNSRTRTSSTQSTDGDEGYFSQVTRTSVTSDMTPTTAREDFDNVFEPALTAPFSNLRRLSEVDTPSPSSCSDILSRGNSADEEEKRSSSRQCISPQSSTSAEDTRKSSTRQRDV